ncbi:MAG: GNAT family N-acetyltransferase [Rhodobacteraceae bacterium]|nr:GNAT family N-acetyltransferase [Paracoccaceae bacterium]
MTEPRQIEVSILESIADIAAAEWDSCACPEPGPPIDPFTTHRFLLALEQSGSVGAGSGWQPRHLVAKRGEELLGVMPLYAKSHSQGEYIFDFSWADAYARAGGNYYPKLQSAVPFTPATGRRLLAPTDAGRAALLQGAIRIAKQNSLSSFHITFCTEDEFEFGGNFGLMQRTTRQFHWLNQGYKSFDDFLPALSSRKRKNIRKERREAQAFGGKIISLTGDQIQPEHWDAFWQFYQDTGARKWGTPYLTREFFNIAQETLRDDILLVLAQRNGQYVAGALNFIGAETLFGRYWGASEHHACLHFELCYYQAIDAAIKRGLRRVEAGAQGEHKLARGYLPVPVHSLHWIADEGFANAVQVFLNAETEAINEDIIEMRTFGPFRKGKNDGRT